jgi:hypothetical protein
MKNLQLNLVLSNTSARYILKNKFSLWLSRYFIFIIPIIISFVFSMCQPSSSNSTRQIIQSVPCVGKVQYHKNGKLQSCYLAQDYRIEGNQLPAGSRLFFFKDGNPSECWISKEASFYGQSLPAKTSVFFNRWGFKFSFWLPKEMRIQGHLIPSTHDGVGNSLHLNGKLKAIWLADDEEINGVPCSSSGDIRRFGKKVLSLGTKRMVWFYDNGNLQQAMISRDITIQGYPFKKGDIIYFGADGRIDLNAKKLE